MNNAFPNFFAIFDDFFKVGARQTCLKHISPLHYVSKTETQVLDARVITNISRLTEFPTRAIPNLIRLATEILELHIKMKIYNIFQQGPRNRGGRGANAPPKFQILLLKFLPENDFSKML